ncbi:MAG TPA: hypothetical protein VH087_07855 [Thermoanaerobaculia bacterium]|jgi:hypothetical protein|nr:hypothetical protein [Thermoanaerobaculia bacterium]
MKTTVTKWATKAAGAGAVALLLATPAFAQSRGDWNRNNNSNRGAQATQTRDANRSHNQFNNTNSYRNNSNVNSNSYRDNQRVTTSGRVTSFARERDGYRVGLDRGGSYSVPESRGRGLRTGLSVSIGGVFRGGSVFVDTVGSPAYDAGYVRGVVESVDYRTGTVWLRDDASGREISAAVGSGYALGSLQRGELVELTGQWLGNGVFDVARIASIR